MFSQREEATSDNSLIKQQPKEAFFVELATPQRTSYQLSAVTTTVWPDDVLALVRSTVVSEEKRPLQTIILKRPHQTTA